MKNKLFTLTQINPIDVIVEDRARKDLGDLKELKNSIEESGLINPILITQEGRLIAGERRLKAVIELDYDTIDARISPDIDQDDFLLMEMMENVARKEFNWTEELALKHKLHNYWIDQAEKAKEPWGYRDTAAKLRCSLGGLSTDLALAKAIDSFPQLKNFETKAQAKNAYKKLGDGAVAMKAMDNLSDEDQEKLKNLQMGNISVDTSVDGKPNLVIPTATNTDSVPDYITSSDRSPVEHPAKKKKLEYCYLVEGYETFLDKIPNETVGLIELDPPYAIDFNENYGKVSKIKSKATDWTTKQLYNFYKEYLPILHTKLLDNSWVICWTGKEHFNETNKIAAASGFKVQQPGVWVKPGGSSNTPKTNMISNFEMFLLFRKGDATFNTASFPSVITFNSSPASQRIHQWEKPIEMYQYIITAMGKPGSIFLSPFAGSGNALLAAGLEQMIPMGCDQSQKYMYGFVDRWSQLFNREG